MAGKEKFMRLDKLTLKAQEAFQEAQNIAGKFNQQEITPEHILLAFLQQEGGVVPAIFSKVGTNANLFVDKLMGLIKTLPQVTGSVASQVYISSILKRVMDNAFKEAEILKDEFVSSEHVLIAISSEKDCKAGEMLREQGMSKKVILKILQDVRGPHRVTDQDPEGKYQALKKYACDLTEMARQGKLDPVIGRDDEIRRVIRPFTSHKK